MVYIKSWIATWEPCLKKSEASAESHATQFVRPITDYFPPLFRRTFLRANDPFRTGIATRGGRPKPRRVPFKKLYDGYKKLTAWFSVRDDGRTQLDSEESESDDGN